MAIIRNPIRELFRREERIPAREGTTEGVTVELGPTKQPAFAASQDTIDKSLAILNLGSDGKVRDDLRRPLIIGLKGSLANDEKLQGALVEEFGPPVKNQREIQIAVDILDLGIPFSINQLSSSGNSNPSLRKHLSSSSEKKVQPPDLWSKISDQSLKIVLEHANTVINTELGKQSSGSITEDLNLFKREIDSLEDKINSANKGQVANPKKLLTLGNAVKLGLIGLAAGTVTELTGVTDFSSLGPNKGVTPPPEQVITNHVMKEISSFPGKDLSKETQSTIQDRIDTNLNKLPTTFSMRPTAYVEDTKKPVSANGQVIGVQVEAQVDTNPIKIIYQESTTGNQITIIPEKNQDGDIMVKIIKVPAGGTPTVEEQTGR
jgi:hypothetical protein